MSRFSIPVLLSLTLLGGCGKSSGDALTSSGTFRDPSVIIASKADFNSGNFAGEWHEIARFPDGRGCTGGRRLVEAEGDGALSITSLCPDGRTELNRATVAPLGRLIVTGGPQIGPLWVLWTDTSYRTAILARPDGGGAQILNRTPSLPKDRLDAALDVLEFNGFRTKLMVFGPT